MRSVAFSTLALALLLPLAACGQGPQNASPTGTTDPSARATSATGENTSGSMISREIQKGMQDAKRQLATSNIDVNSVHIGAGRSKDSDSRPKAQITPQGELLIAGKQVAATPAQHALLLDYRKQIVGIAEAGMDIGTKGADLGIQAAKAALSSVFSGKSDKDIQAVVEPQADRIRAAALKLCQRLPALLSSQQKLAAAMPRFRPYATMQQKDVEDCGEKMSDRNGKKGFAVFSN